LGGGGGWVGGSVVEGMHGPILFFFLTFAPCEHKCFNM